MLEAPDYLRGVIQYNQQQIPIIDLKVKLNMAKTNFTVNTCLIIYNEVVHDTIFQAGLLADALHDINKGKTEENDLISEPVPQYLDVLLKDNDNKILTINMNHFFSVHDLLKLSNTLEKAIF
ncbi:MAG: chemotaxis protein CheW [Bacteroidota bacterium]|nr:chemotaxis protein CheW [Bacteroidota bacterium]